MRLSDQAAAKSESEFREWASLLSGELLVKISVYADESGTHDKTGNLPGSKIPVIAGYAARRFEWARFCVAWKAVLNKYKAPYFHSREVRAAKAAIENNKEESKELPKKSILPRPLVGKKVR